MSAPPVLYRCPKCGRDDVGHDAASSWDAAAQEWVLGSEYDNGWCADCGDVDPEEYTPEGQELERLKAAIAARATAERLSKAAPDLLAALKDALPCVASTGTFDAFQRIKVAIANADCAP